MKTKKYLYCPKCKKYPDEIIEEYEAGYRQFRHWDGDCYEMDTDNIDVVLCKNYCLECETELVEK